MGKQLDAKKTGFTSNLMRLFDDLESFRLWYNPKYHGLSAETVWKNIGGTLPKKKVEKEGD